MTISKTIPPN